MSTTYFSFGSSFSGPVTSLIAVLIKRWSKPSELTLAITIATTGYGLAYSFVAFLDGALLTNGIGWVKLYIFHGCLGSVLTTKIEEFKMAYSWELIKRCL